MTTPAVLAERINKAVGDMGYGPVAGLTRAGNVGLRHPQEAGVPEAVVYRAMKVASEMCVAGRCQHPGEDPDPPPELLIWAPQ